MNLKMNWKTTLSGLGVIFATLGNVIAQYTKGGLGAVDFGVFFAGMSMGIGLICAKDFNVTGGTKPATDEAAQRVASAPAEASKGHATTLTLGWIVTLAVLLVLAFAAFAPRIARADVPGPTPNLGVCIDKDNHHCFAPRVALPAMEITKTGSVGFGALAGFGFGYANTASKVHWGVAPYLTAIPDPSGLVNVQKVKLSLMFDFFDYVNLGPSWVPGPKGGTLTGLVCLGTSLGSSPARAAPGA